uniref:Uncharacterized protein n=1 Tax=Tanacetum cinerariifolium TaxID=118510 RepID=A0A6L2LIC5_TANCI|nr:hypothetical protein [Tanacetum cinerariifolium]
MTIVEYIEYEARMKRQNGHPQDLGASVNVMPKSMFGHLKLANLKETNMLVKMANMTKKIPLEILENILDYRMWPTCNLDLSFCSGYDVIYRKGEHGMLEQWMCFRDNVRQSVGGNRMIFTVFLKVRYENKNIDDTTCKRRYYEWVAQNSEFNDNGASHETTMYNNPCKYHLEYPHSYFPQKDKGKKGYALYDVCEKCEKFHGDTLYPWHDEGSEEKERWESGIEKTNYEPPFVDIETFKIKKYSFDRRRSFIFITKQLDDALPLGRANMSRFIGMIGEEMDKE